MVEMLGNQFFMIRDYRNAAEVYEKVLQNSNSKEVRKKIIICYIQLGKINEALKTFSTLIEEDITVIVNTNLADDDCPCPQLVYDFETEFKGKKISLDYFLVLGMLWLYCDMGRSLFYFNEAQKQSPNNFEIKKILEILEQYQIN